MPEPIGTIRYKIVWHTDIYNYKIPSPNITFLSIYTKQFGSNDDVKQSYLVTRSDALTTYSHTNYTIYTIYCIEAHCLYANTNKSDICHILYLF